MVISRYVEGHKEPLYYFGEGYSYTTFVYSNLQVNNKINAESILNVSCDVQNAGDVDGEEVVQVYVTDELASMVRPAQELAGFYRVRLNAHETKRIHFTMKASQFAFLDTKMRWLVEAGKMTLKIGASSKDIRLTSGFEISNSAYIDGKDRGFYAKAWEKTV
jgi:beta-glucosidase